MANSVNVPAACVILLMQESASVLYAWSQTLLTFVCHTLVLPDSHLITQATGCQCLIWVSSYSSVFISSYQSEAAIHSHSCRRCLGWQTARPVCADADVFWYLSAQEQLWSTALNRKSSEKLLFMEGQRVHLYINYHQIFFTLSVWVCHADLKLLRTNRQKKWIWNLTEVILYIFTENTTNTHTHTH